MAEISVGARDGRRVDSRAGSDERMLTFDLSTTGRTSCLNRLEVRDVRYALREHSRSTGVISAGFVLRAQKLLVNPDVDPDLSGWSGCRVWIRGCLGSPGSSSARGSIRFAPERRPPLIMCGTGADGFDGDDLSARRHCRRRRRLALRTRGRFLSRVRRLHLASLSIPISSCSSTWGLLSSSTARPPEPERSSSVPGPRDRCRRTSRLGD